MIPERKRVSVLQHLNELRIRMLRVGIVSLVLIVIALIFYRQIIGFFTDSVSDIITGAGGQIASRSVTEPWTVAARVAVMAGFVATLPYLLFELWLYIRPALKRSESSSLLLVLPGSLLFFGAGAAFAYYLLAPFFFRFLISFGSAIEGLATLPSLESTVGVLVSLMFSLGLVFQLPIVMFVLGKFGILKHSMLARRRRWVILVAFIAGAALTPTIDPLTQILVAAPIVLLFELGLVFVWVSARGKVKKPAATASG